MTKPRIALTILSMCPFNFSIYCAGLQEREFKKTEIDKNAPYKWYKACIVRLGMKDLICPEEKQTSVHLYRIQESKLREDQIHLPNPANGRVSELSRRAQHIVDFGRQVWILQNPYR